MQEKLEIVVNVAAGVGLVFAGYAFFKYREDRNIVLERRAKLNWAKLYSPLLK